MAISTTKQIDVEESLREDLSQYLCGSIWNQPLTELRRNIVLRTMNKGRCVKSLCEIGGDYVRLPDAPDKAGRAHEYYVYAAACCCMGGLVVDCDQSDIANLTHYGDWIKLEDYLNARPFDLRIHSAHGEWLCRNYIYIRNHPTADMFLLAIDAPMAEKILGDDYSFTTMYMSVYYDSDNTMTHLDETSPRIIGTHVVSRNDINDIYNAYMDADRDKTMFFINGRHSYPSSLFDISLGDYIELVYDPDIIANIVLDMVQSRDSHLYTSTIDGSLKYIIHIPKSKNPDNLIITHNTCDIFINPVNTSPVENANLKGLFVHRFDTSHRTYTYAETTDTVYRKGREYYLYNTESGAYVKKTLKESDYGTEIKGILYVRTAEYLSDHLITQITHNDFGVSEKILQPYMDQIGSSECAIRVVVRRHGKGNTLDRDCNFLKLLYNFDDETILNFLNGKLMTSCSFWQASELEQSEWVKALFEVPSSAYPESTSHYINALGYYNSACVIATRVASGLYSNQNTHSLDFTIPRSLQESDALDALLSVNGVLLSPDQYTCEKSMQYLHFDINTDVSLSANDKLVAEIFEKKKVWAEYFTPTSSNTTFVIPEESAEYDFELYQVKDDCVIPEDYFTSTYVDKTDLRGYKKISDQDSWIVLPVADTYRVETSNTTCVDNGCTNESHKGTVVTNVLTKRTITFKPASWDKTFLIVSKNIYGRYDEGDIQLSGGNTKLGTLTSPDGKRTCSDLLHTGKLMLKCKKWSDSSTITIPIIDKDWSIIPACNGRELVNGVDYSDILVKDTSGYVLYRTLLFSIGGFGESTSINDKTYYTTDSYLKYAGNTFDIILTDDKIFSRYNGFAFSDERFTPSTGLARSNNGSVAEMPPLVYWFDGLSKLVVDGKTTYNPSSSNGKLTFKDNHRNGALYCSRGIVPSRTADFIEQYKDGIEDIEKLAHIVEYMRSLVTSEDSTISVIEHSHHITSISTNCLIKDVITGKKELYWTSAVNQIEEMLQEYRTLSKYDPAISGSIKDIEITNAGSAIVNDRYHLTDVTATGNDRIWTSSTGKCDVTYNTALSRWEISVYTIYGKSVYYYATSETEADPWDLGWNKGNGVSKMPVFSSQSINHNYVDVLPSYTSDMHEVEEDIMLRRCVNTLLPTDTTKDGATTL